MTSGFRVIANTNFELMDSSRKIFWVLFYSIAMGFLEAAVVIYLRRIFYTHGFAFPLAPMPGDIVTVEVLREAATIIMLVAIGVLAGSNRAERFAWFIFSFAVWDIFYYVFLYVFLGWPQSMFTWDVLFLIPVPWTSPVIAPVIIACTMVLYASAVVYLSGRQFAVGFKKREWLTLLLGSVVVIIAFTKDYIQQNGAILYRAMQHGGPLPDTLANYIPKYFDWITFSMGEIILLISWYIYVRRLKHRN